MALQQLKSGLFVPEMPEHAPNVAYGGMTIDASGEKVATIFRVPKSGTINKVGFRVGSVTGSQTLRAGLQTVDSSGGNAGFPSGSAYGGMVAGTQASPSANTAYEVTLGTGATATADDVVALVVEFDSSVGNLQISIIDALHPRKSFPYMAQFTAAWAKSAAVLPVAWVGYNDGSYEPISTYPYNSIETGNTFASNSTPDERALRFQLPFPARYCGFWAFIFPQANFDVVLYEGTTAKVTTSIDVDQLASGGLSQLIERLGTTYDLAANTEYFLSLKPTTTTQVSVGEFTTLSAGVMDCLSGGQPFHFGSRTDAGAWSKTTTKRPLFGIILDKLDDAAGGGSGGGAQRVIGAGF